MIKKALILGVNGQDGQLLYTFLSKKNYKIIGIGKKELRKRRVSWSKKVDITKPIELASLIKKFQPDEIYHLAAFHHSAQDWPINSLEIIRKSYRINVFSLLNVLEAVRLYSPQTKIFYAASSLIFGNTKSKIQNESTTFQPQTIYGINKLDGLLLCRYYREQYGIFVSVGILYNHESAFRLEKFLSRKIIQGAIDIKNGIKKELIIGDLGAQTDWGYAEDYILAMVKILAATQADEFIIATGEKHSVGDFAKIAFSYFGLNWREYVRENPGIIKRKGKVLVGDATKLRKITHWRQATSFQQMIVKIIKELDK